MAGYESDRDSTHKIESPQFSRKSNKLSLTRRLQERYKQDSSIGTNVSNNRPTEQDTVHDSATQPKGLHLSEGNHATNNMAILPPYLCAIDFKHHKDQQLKNDSSFIAMVNNFKTRNELLPEQNTSESENKIEKKTSSEELLERSKSDSEIAFIEKNENTGVRARFNSESIQLCQKHEIMEEAIEEQKYSSCDYATKKNEIVQEFNPITQPEFSFDGETENSNLKRNIDDSDCISDEDSSVLSSEDSISFLEKCERKRSRNTKFLENQGFFTKVKKKMESVDNRSHKKYKGDCFSCEQVETNKKLKGMIFATKQNSNIIMSSNFKENKIALSLTSVEDVESRFPFRSSQIRYLHSLLSSTVRQAKISSHQTQESIASGRPNVFVPPPIFVTGSRGSGKTSIVENIIQSIKQNLAHSHVQDCRDNIENGKEVRITIADAYIDCGLIESSSLKQILKNVYKQIKSDFISSESAQKVKQFEERAKIKEKNSTHQSNSHSTSGSKKAKDNTFIDDILRNDYENHVNKGDFCHMDDEDSVDEDNIERQRRNQIRINRTERKQKENVSNGAERETNLLSFNNTHKTEFSTLGRALTKFCGINRGDFNGNGCAYIVLDHAEKMFSLNSKRQSSNMNQTSADFNNLLTQFLLLPRVVGLNLTIIVISSGNLLGFSRINNIQSHLVSLGTLEDALNPIQIHFHAYRGKAVFKQILSLPKIKELVVGVEDFGILMPNEDENLCDDVKSKILNIIYESMIDTILQSVEGTTRDVREMIRLSRQLWPEYIKPILFVDKASNDIDHKFIFDQLFGIEKDYRSVKKRCLSNNSPVILDKKHTLESAKSTLQEMLHNKARPHVRKLLHESLLRPGNGNIFLSTSPSGLSKNTLHCKPGKQKFQHTEQMPYLTKFLLLAAYLCQSNKPDYDRNLYTNQRVKGGRKKDTGEKISDPGSLTHASSALAQKELKKIRVQSFPLERMLSIFSSILNKYGKDSPVLERCTKSGFLDLKQMGTITLFANLAQLQQCNLLYQVGNIYNDGKKQLKFSSLSSAKFVCTLTKDHAEEISTQLQFPLLSYVFHCQ